MSRIVVLGWDALDAELIDEFGLSGRFGAHTATIDTYANPVIDEPHTRELWPSLITGLHPDEHGIHAVSDADGVNWDSPLLDTLSNVATGVVPKPVRNVIGAQLRQRGARLDEHRPAYYDDLPTVFDEQGRAISIPNYRTAFDEQHDLDATRDDVWGDLLANRDGVEGFEPTISTSEIYTVLGREVGKRLGATLTAAQQHNLTWTWFGALDTVGHVDPAIGAELQRDFYTIAANVTETVHETVDDDTTVLCLSDHGLQDGAHTHYATVASNDAAAVEAIDSIYDVAPWVRERLSGPQQRPDHSLDGEGMAQVRNQLEDLGYV